MIWYTNNSKGEQEYSPDHPLHNKMADTKIQTDICEHACLYDYFASSVSILATTIQSYLADHKYKYTSTAPRCRPRFMALLEMSDWSYSKQHVEVWHPAEPSTQQTGRGSLWVTGVCVRVCTLKERYFFVFSFLSLLLVFMFLLSLL